jgi:hemerythrin-like metal-binding protein
MDGSLMESIDIFPWDNHFNTGIVTIDEQHMRLVELLNTLARAVAFKSDDLRLNQIFDELLDYTVYHFKTEEAIWAEYFPHDSLEEEHKEVHQRFIDTVVRLKSEQLERSISEIAQEALAFLARWLASHILETDRLMAYVVLSLQEGNDMESAKYHAVQKMSGFTRTLIDLILSIYETLSSNTLQLMYEIKKQKQLEADNVELESKLYIGEEYQRTILANSSHKCNTYAF